MMSLPKSTEIHPINTPGVLWEVSHVELVILQFRWKRLAQPRTLRFAYRVSGNPTKPVPPELGRLFSRPFEGTHRGRSMGPAHRWPLRSNKLKLSPRAASGSVPSSPVRYTCTIRSSLPSGSLNQYHPSMIGACVVQITPPPSPTTSMRVHSKGWLKDQVSRIQATREIESGQDYQQEEPVAENIFQDAHRSFTPPRPCPVEPLIRPPLSRPAISIRCSRGKPLANPRR